MLTWNSGLWRPLEEEGGYSTESTAGVNVTDKKLTRKVILGVSVYIFDIVYRCEYFIEFIKEFAKIFLSLLQAKLPF